MRRVLQTVRIAALFSSLLGQAQQTEDAYSLTGKVSDFVTHQGVPYSTIKARATFGKTFTTVTATDGSYTLGGLSRNARIHVTCHQLGYRPDPKEQDLVVDRPHMHWDVRLFAASPDAAYLDKAAIILYENNEVGTEEEAKAFADVLPTSQLITMSTSLDRKIRISPPNPRQQAIAQLIRIGSERDDVDAPHQPGVYALRGGTDGRMQITRVEAARPGTRAGDRFASSLMNGITKRYSRQYFEGSEARVEFNQLRPTFLIFLGDEPPFSGVDPKKLVLSELRVDGERRSMNLGSIDLDEKGSQRQYNEKPQSFLIQEVRSGVYKFTPATDLMPGQYVLREGDLYFEFGIEAK